MRAAMKTARQLATSARPTRLVSKRRLWMIFDTVTRRYPVSAKMTVGAALGCVGDLVAQYGEKHHRQSPDVCSVASNATDADGVDWARVGRMALWRCFVTPITHHWFNILEGRFPGFSPANVMKRLVVDGIFAMPLVNGLFFPFMALLEGEGLEVAAQRYKAKIIPMLQSAYSFWPFVNLLSFSLVPLRHRVHCGNAASLIWTIYMSWLNVQR
eukprot:TRINITY_DN62830_c0_g1_i1.p1 TRINITY_DN62830_c0_g1~~TRINITY_DN62830_c0_g1_i1.p1  ORF type:complete len:213 (+),score=25.70 TRINITY_DN62830_c0_g1_i1:131-769(+)